MVTIFKLMLSPLEAIDIKTNYLKLQVLLKQNSIKAQASVILTYMHVSIYYFYIILTFVRCFKKKFILFDMPKMNMILSN